MSPKLVSRLYWWSFRTLPMLALLIMCNVIPNGGGG